jgi:hypothetical protein
VTLHAKVYLAAGIAILLLSGWFFVIWLQAHDDKLKAQATVEAQQEAFDKAVDEIKSLREADTKRDALTAATIAQLTQAAAAQKTPEQIVRWIPQQAPGLPQPITVNIPPSTPSNPTPNAVASIPQADLPKLRDTIESCQLNAVRVTACAADLASRESQLKIAGEQLSVVEKERDAYQTALKGGTFFTRVKRAGKWIVFGGGLTIVAVCGTGHCK